MKPGTIGEPLFGTELVLLSPDNTKILATTKKFSGPVKDGKLCIASPWPGLANDWLENASFGDNYIIPSTTDGREFFSTGDVASVDEDGYLKITGRIDDQLCVNGHRIGPAEIEAVMIENPLVSEAAVIGIPNDRTGQAIVAFAVSHDKSQKIVDDLKKLIQDKFSAIGRPSCIYIVDDLPKTRSGKIIRKLLRAIFTNEDIGDVPTLTNPSVIDHLKSVVKE